MLLTFLCKQIEITSANALENYIEIGLIEANEVGDDKKKLVKNIAVRLAFRSWGIRLQHIDVVSDAKGKPSLSPHSHIPNNPYQ